MQAGPRRSLFRELASHLAMGAGLGAFLALSLIVTDARHIFDMIVNSSAPRLTIAVLVSTFVLIFAIGASLTGMIFISMEDN